jgi:hypothetical protein
LEEYFQKYEAVKNKFVSSWPLFNWFLTPFSCRPLSFIRLIFGSSTDYLTSPPVKNMEKAFH